MRAHWRHLANMTQLVLSSANPSPQPKWQMDRFSHFCTAHGRVSSACPTMSFPLIIAPPHGRSGPQLIRASLGQPESITQMTARSVQPFLQSSCQSVSGQCQRACWACPSSLKLPIPMGDLWFLGSTGLNVPNGISVGSVVFAQVTAECPYTLRWALLFPQNYPFPWENVDPF